jgi:hypothetical protein
MEEKIRLERITIYSLTIDKRSKKEKNELTHNKQMIY